MTMVCRFPYTLHRDAGIKSKENLHQILRTTANIRINLYCPNLESLDYIIVSDNDNVVYLHLNFCCRLWKTHVLWNTLCNGPWRSSKVDFGTNWNLVCDFLLVINSSPGPTLPRFRDIALTKDMQHRWVCCHHQGDDWILWQLVQINCSTVFESINCYLACHAIYCSVQA